MRHRYGVQRPFELAGPEVQELVQHRKLRRQIVFLPNERLQQLRVVRQPVKDRRRRQPVTLELTDERLRDHETSFLEAKVPEGPGPYTRTMLASARSMLKLLC